METNYKDSHPNMDAMFNPNTRQTADKIYKRYLATTTKKAQPGQTTTTH